MRSNEEIISDVYTALRDVLNRAGSQVNNGYAPQFLITELERELQKYGLIFAEAENHYTEEDMRKCFSAGVDRGVYIETVINNNPIDESPSYKQYIEGIKTSKSSFYNQLGWTTDNHEYDYARSGNREIDPANNNVNSSQGMPLVETINQTINK